jgi:hypothetical protein
MDSVITVNVSTLIAVAAVVIALCFGMRACELVFGDRSGFVRREYDLGSSRVY